MLPVYLEVNIILSTKCSKFGVHRWKICWVA